MKKDLLFATLVVLVPSFAMAHVSVRGVGALPPSTPALPRRTVEIDVWSTLIGDRCLVGILVALALESACRRASPISGST